MGDLSARDTATVSLQLVANLGFLRKVVSNINDIVLNANKVCSGLHYVG